LIPFFAPLQPFFRLALSSLRSPKPLFTGSPVRWLVALFHQPSPLSGPLFTLSLLFVVQRIMSFLISGIHAPSFLPTYRCLPRKNLTGEFLFETLCFFDSLNSKMPAFFFPFSHPEKTVHIRHHEIVCGLTILFPSRVLAIRNPGSFF